VLTLLGEGEGNTVNRHKTYQVSARVLSTYRPEASNLEREVYWQERAKNEKCEEKSLKHSKECK